MEYETKIAEARDLLIYVQRMELWGIPIEIREKMPFDNIGIIKEGF